VHLRAIVFIGVFVPNRLIVLLYALGIALLTS
jgi:hypothetical protein